MHKQYWVAEAFSKHKGALTKTAKSKGISVAGYCAMHPGGKSAKRCALRKTAMGFKHTK